jgi:hypothetical protein
LLSLVILEAFIMKGITMKSKIVSLISSLLLAASNVAMAQSQPSPNPPTDTEKSTYPSPKDTANGRDASATKKLDSGRSSKRLNPEECRRLATAQAQKYRECNELARPNASESTSDAPR